MQRFPVLLVEQFPLICQEARKTDAGDLCDLLG